MAQKDLFLDWMNAVKANELTSISIMVEDGRVAGFISGDKQTLFAAIVQFLMELDADGKEVIMDAFFYYLSLDREREDK
jgi:hypothetical protein